MWRRVVWDKFTDVSEKPYSLHLCTSIILKMEAANFSESRYTPTRLYCVISPKTAIFIVLAVIKSNRSIIISWRLRIKIVLKHIRLLHGLLYLACFKTRNADSMSSSLASHRIMQLKHYKAQGLGLHQRDRYISRDHVVTEASSETENTATSVPTYTYLHMWLRPSKTTTYRRNA
jgi:hypothetical protein